MRPGVAVLLAPLALPLSPSPTLGQSSPLLVTNAWARPGRPGGMSAVYAVFRNNGGRGLTITGVSCEPAAMTHLHRSTIENDMVRMSAVSSLEVAAGDSVELRPGGLHIMLMGLRRALNTGDSFGCELSAGGEMAGSFQVTVRAN